MATKISALAEHIGETAGAYVPVVVGGATYKLDAARMGSNSFVNVGNYGVAIGNTAAANAAGFQAALIAAATAGKDVFCPFSFTTNPVNISQSNIKIFSRGQQTAITLSAAAWAINTVFVDITGVNVTIENITLNGHASNFASSLNIKGLHCNVAGFMLNNVHVTNFEDAITGTGASYCIIQQCLFDNIGGRVVYVYDSFNLTIKNNIIREWARHTNDCSAVEILSNTLGGCDNMLMQGNQIFNPNNSSKFFVETPGSTVPLRFAQFINERYDGGGFTTGCVSCWLDNTSIINPSYKNFGRYALGAECSGDNVSLIGGDYGNTVIRMATYTVGTRVNLLISGCIFNSLASSPIDAIISLRGNESVGTPSVFQNVVIENCVFNSKLCNNVSFVAISGYMTVNDFVFANNTIYGNPSGPAAVLYFTTNSGSRIFIRNNNLIDGDGWIVTDRGTYTALIVHNNYTTGQLFHSSFTSTAFPGYIEHNNIASDGIKHVAAFGSPEGVYTARVGSTYHRKDGGAGTTFYVKETGTGNTGWVAK